MTHSGSERMIRHTGTETRTRLLREAAVGNIAQWRKPDAATPRGGWHISVRKLLLYKKIMTVLYEYAPANSVPAAAVIRRVQALFGITGRKGCVGGLESQM